MLFLAMASAVTLGATDTIDVSKSGPRDVPVGVAAPADTAPQGRHRPRAIELSDAYETRLKIHRIASYATIPLFVTQYIAGTNLYNADASGAPRPAWASSIHRPIAYALGGLFAVNSVTGAMNWWETRHQSQGRTWRTIHAALMLASDAGFAYTGTLGTRARGSYVERDHHRNWAITSSLVALTSYAMMLDPIRRDR